MRNVTKNKSKPVTAKTVRSTTAGFNIAIPRGLHKGLVALAADNGYAGKTGWSKFALSQLKKIAG